MQCAACQSDNRDGAQFCRACGERLGGACPKCGAAAVAGNRYCDVCGTPLGDGVAPAVPGPALPGLGIPASLAEKIRDARPGLEGERKQVTVLFCDIASSTPLAQALGPEGMHVLLDEFFRLALHEVHRYEGVINQFLGDGFMALFGAPVAHEDHERRAVLAALGVQRALAARQEHEPDWAGRTLRIRMGLHTGSVVVGNIGDNLRMDYTAVGDTTNLAARLQQLAEPGTIVASEAVVAPLRDDLHVEPLGPTAVRGRAEPVTAYRVLGLLARGAGPEGGARRLGAFVGRARELTQLHTALAEVEREPGEGRVVGIVGDPGVGKSRLLLEFRRAAAPRGITWLEGHCVSWGASVPYLPWVEIVRASCGLVEADAPAAIAAKVGRALGALDMDTPETRAHLLRLLGLERAPADAPVPSPEAIKAATFEALRQLVLRTSRRGPTVLAIENLHWIDRTSEECLAALVDAVPRARILLLATYRAPYRPRWIERSYVSQSALAHLSAEDSLAVIRSAPASEALPEPVVAGILAKAEGNPFFLEELTRHVVEHGEPGREPDLPGTVQEVLMARIDRLSPDAKRLLQAASVVGRVLPHHLLAAVWEGPEGPDRPLAELRRLELLYETGMGDEPVYAFKHALIQEVAYGSLLTPRRQRLHARVAETLEVLHRDRLEEVHDRLAYHYSRTTAADKAVEYLTRLADRAARWYANAEAVAALREARAHAERLPAGEARDRLTLTLSLREAHSLHFLGRFEEIRDLLLAQEARMARLDDPAVAGEYHFRLGRTFDVLADHDRAVACARRAIAEAERAGNPIVVGKAHFVLAYVGYWTGRYADGVEHGRRAVAALEAGPERWWLGEAHWVTGINHAMAGAFDDALAELGRAQAIGEALMDPRLQTTVAFTAGGIHALRGNWDTAIARCRDAIELARDPVGAAVARGFLGGSFIEKGEAEAAIPLLEDSVAQLARFHIRQTQGWFTAWLAQAYFLAGRLDRARALAEEALRMTLGTRHLHGVGWAQRTLGHVARAAGDLPEAEARLREAVETFTGVGARYEEARTRLDLAGLHADQGRADAGAAELTAAHGLLRRLGEARYDTVASGLARTLGVTLPA